MTNPPNNKRRRWPRILLAVLCAILVAAVLLGGIYWWLYTAGRRSLFGQSGSVSTPSSLVDTDDGDTVEYNGVTYRYNEDVTGILFLGVDKQDIQSEGGYGSNGQADSLFLAAMDTRTGTIRIIPISRETMVDVDRYAQDGTYLGTQRTQLCLAYAYGATAQQSCENVVRSAKRLLYGVPINSYIAIDLEGVKALTDAVGGVPVTALEDVNNPNISMDVKKGQTVTLTGAKAQFYIQFRGQDVDANNRRMQRQKQFLGAFVSTAGGQLKRDFTRLTAYYNAAKPYVASDLTLPQITYLVTQALAGNGWKNFEYYNLAGETVMGENHVEFYADRTSAYEAVLATFYTKAE